MTEQTTSTPTEPTEQSTATPAAKGDQAAPKPEPVMIPKERLDAEIAKKRELEARLAEWEAAKKKQADDEAAKAGQIEKFKTERDQFETEAKQWREYATAKLNTLTERLDDAGRSILADLEDAPLAKRLAIAEKLASEKKSDPGFGTNGGGGQKAAGGVIPPNVTSRTDYHNWLANLRTTPEGMALLADRKKMETIRAEAQAKFK